MDKGHGGVLKSDKGHEILVTSDTGHFLISVTRDIGVIKMTDNSIKSSFLKT